MSYVTDEHRMTMTFPYPGRPILLFPRGEAVADESADELEDEFWLFPGPAATEPLIIPLEDGPFTTWRGVLGGETNTLSKKKQTQVYSSGVILITECKLSQIRLSFIHSSVKLFISSYHICSENYMLQ